MKITEKQLRNIIKESIEEITYNQLTRVKRDNDSVWNEWYGNVTSGDFESAAKSLEHLANPDSTFYYPHENQETDRRVKMAYQATCTIRDIINRLDKNQTEYEDRQHDWVDYDNDFYDDTENESNHARLEDAELKDLRQKYGRK